MPYRRLPNTDTARLRAMKTALDKTSGLPPFKLPFEISTHQELKNFLPEFRQAIQYQKDTLDRQAEKSKLHAERFKKARIYISHFIQVLNFAIIRGELKSDIRKLFGFEENDKKLPQLNTEKDIIDWGNRLIEGEQKRVMQGQAPITNPTIARVKVHFEDFLRIHKSQKHLQETHQKATQKMAQLREKADELILNLWNEVEEHFSDMPHEERREKSANYGVVYVFRKNEKLSFKNLRLDSVS